MKKLIAFSTALLMLSSSAANLVLAEEAEDTNETVTAADAETTDEAAETTEEENTEEDTADSEDTAETPSKQDDTVWHITTSSPAEAELTDSTEGREYFVKVINPGGEERGGVDKWDLQFKICGFSIAKNHDYTIRYRVSADNAGSFYTKIANPESKTVGEANSGEVWHNQYGVSTIMSYLNGTMQKDAQTSYSNAWNNQEINKGDTLNITCNFTGLEDLPEAEWCFFLGGAGSTTAYDCFSPGTVVIFSNLVLIDNTTGETVVSAYPDVYSDVKGDINADGVADTTDLTLMSLAMIGDEKLDDTQLTSCDLTGDGKFLMGDIAHMKQFLSKMIDEL